MAVATLIIVSLLLALELVGLLVFRKKLREDAARRIADNLVKAGVGDQIARELERNLTYRKEA